MEFEELHKLKTDNTRLEKCIYSTMPFIYHSQNDTISK